MGSTETGFWLAMRMTPPVTPEAAADAPADAPADAAALGAPPAAPGAAHGGGGAALGPPPAAVAAADGVDAAPPHAAMTMPIAPVERPRTVARWMNSRRLSRPAAKASMVSSCSGTAVLRTLSNWR